MTTPDAGPTKAGLPKPWLAKPGGIAERLRELHNASGLTGKDLAEQLGWAPSKVTRIRQGVVAPTGDDITAWAEATGAADQTAALAAVLEVARRERAAHYFRNRMAGGQAAVQRDYNRLVADSTTVRYFDTIWIPGLLQTRDYARHVFQEMRRLHGPLDDVDDAIRERMARQQYLRDTGKRFEFLIFEPALLCNFAPADVMRPQLGHLLTWLDAANVRVGILPLKSRPPHAVMPQNKFEIYDDYVVVEMFHGEDAPDGYDYGAVLDAMWQVAAEGDDARRLILAAVDALEAPDR